MATDDPGACPPQKTVLVIENGGPSPAVQARWGRFTDWFGARLPAEIRLQSQPGSAPLPDPGALGADGVILSGSSHSVRDGLPWAGRMGAWARAVAETRPVLAVCFGHQQLAESLGGWVGPSPAGAERGLITLELTPEGRQDALFQGMPEPVQVHSSHADAVLRPPPGAVRLAGTAHTPWQAFALGPRLRAVQFHPEFAPGPMASILDHHGLTGPGRPAIGDPDHGAAILARWAGHWLGCGPLAAPGPGVG